MTKAPARARPKIFPPPEFPPRKLPMFARMPPAVFAVALGILGLSLALKRALAEAQLPQGLADLAMGLAVGLWLFCAVAYGIKIARRPVVVMEELRVLPGRAGLAAATVGALAVAAVLGFFLPGVARVVLTIGLVLQTVLAVLMIRALMTAPAEGRVVTPVWHLSFVGFIVGALAAVPLGWVTLASVILWATIPVAVGIWAISLWQLVQRIPPAPLRPLLAIHLAPASLFASVAGLLGMTVLAQGMLVLACAITLALLVTGRWITQGGFTPLWGAFTFPLAAFASALLINGWGVAGVLVTVFALGGVPVIAWRVLKMWPAGTLATKTNAATA
ncbi:tellurium resistance protein [Pseudotabrizicola alkalilacus]|uniref:Tellurium resistance protein n=1 Tax=Pseudotabrizicola alkalilacus TaxID=2305252 RepID=A0A411YYL5_9RHOB|nr:tellurium resistance protein [Pseudotabrizicola alkalilacus]RGP35997.1 tellurium resistance protein [Pseudotabrizicola alkalilacus]